MQRRWNWFLWAGFIVVLGAVVSYFTFFVDFPATRDVPWVNLLLLAVGLGLLGAGLRRAFARPDVYRGKFSGPVLTALSVLIASLFLFYNFSLSQNLPASEAAPAVGEKAWDFTLPDKNGQPVTLSELWQAEENRWVLLVFYRGYW